MVRASHRVVVISIDGFAAFYWRDPQARLPTLRGLAERGAVAEGDSTASLFTL
jgi:predicted AlkP superfamily pyrophosphatase or phosphodiesterase